MEINAFNVYLLIFLIALFTYIPRSFPLLVLSGRELPNWFVEWMKFIPAGIFAALIAPSIFTTNGSLDLSLNNLELIAATLVLFVSVKKKNLALSIVIGVVSLSILLYL